MKDIMMSIRAQRRIVITGIGIVSPIGIGKDAFWAALREGRDGIRPITLFDTSQTRAKLAGEVVDFHPEDILGKKGLRLLDRTTKFALCASHLALEDAGIEVTENKCAGIGVVLGSTMGSPSSRGDFYVEAIRNGPRAVNPAMFPNTVVNSPASQISIRFGITGLNATISTGFTSALEAMEYAVRGIRLNRIDLALVGGVEELCRFTHSGFENVGLLARCSDGDEYLSAPFDRYRSGAISGEGAAMLVLESLAHARQRQAEIYGEYLGGATITDHNACNTYNPRGDGAKRAIAGALQQAPAIPDDIDYVASGANGSRIGDAAEARALQDALGRPPSSIIVSASKSMIGETFSASGAFQVATALGSFTHDVIPPTIHVQETDPRHPIDCVPNHARPQQVNRTMVSSFSPMGQNTAIVLSRLQEA